MKSDYKAIPKLRDGEQIGVTFERRMTWWERLVLFFQVLPRLDRWFILDDEDLIILKAKVKKAKTLKWFPDTPGWNHPKRMAREVKQIQAMFSKRGMRNARRRLIRMEGKLTKEERIHDDEI